MMVDTAAGRMRVASCSKHRGASSLWGLHLLLCACLGRERGVFLSGSMYGGEECGYFNSPVMYFSMIVGKCVCSSSCTFAARCSGVSVASTGQVAWKRILPLS